MAPRGNDSALAGQPSDLDKLVTALQHFEAGRLGDTAAICTDIVARAPQNWIALRLLGAVHMRQDAFEQATEHIVAALHAAPHGSNHEVELLNDLAGVLLKRADPFGALNCSRRVLIRQPRNHIALYNHGNALLALNQHAEALEQYLL